MTAALISAGAAILVCLLNNFYLDRRRAEKTETDFEVLKAEITGEIRSLTREVEKHNQVIERTYKLEQDVAVAQNDIETLYHRTEGRK